MIQESLGEEIGRGVGRSTSQHVGTCDQLEHLNTDSHESCYNDTSSQPVNLDTFLLY